jgi:hypothetical protein
MRAQTALAAIALVAACRAVDVSTGMPSRELGDARPEIYRALLDTVFGEHFPQFLVVEDSSLLFRYSPNDHRPARHANVPDELLMQLNAVSVTKNALGGLGTPTSWRPVPIAQIRSLFHTNPEIGWANFHARYPGAQGWLGVTPIVVNSEGNQAVVYYEWHCGSLCGQGQLALLARDERGRWRVRYLLGYWIS